MSEYKRDYYKIEDGMVIGYVETCFVGSKAEFEICSLEDAEDMSNEEFEQCAEDAMYESGKLEWGY